VTGGTESPTLAEVFVPRSDRVARIALIGAGVVAISILAQVRIGPIWLQPLAVLLTAAILGSRGGGLTAIIYVALGILGLPVFGPGLSAWSDLGYPGPYLRYGLGYLMGLIAAAFAVGWLTERRSWDRHPANAARLGLAGIALLYLPGSIWAEVAALLMRQTRGPAGVLPSILMLVITVAVLAFGMPRAWAWVAAMQPAAPGSGSGELDSEPPPPERTHSDPPQ
jgi:biotin transport system substrate-specific component